MRLNQLALPVLLATACGPDKNESTEHQTPDCDYAGMNTDVQADLDAGTSDDALLDRYETDFATRISLNLGDASYVGGEISDAKGNTTSFYCIGESGSCKADLYDGCENEAPQWTVNLNDSVAAATCEAIHYSDGEAPAHEPNCSLSDDRLTFSVEGAY